MHSHVDDLTDRCYLVSYEFYDSFPKCSSISRSISFLILYLRVFLWFLYLFFSFLLGWMKIPLSPVEQVYQDSSRRFVILPDFTVNACFLSYRVLSSLWKLIFLYREIIASLADNLTLLRIEKDSNVIPTNVNSTRNFS